MNFFPISGTKLTTFAEFKFVIRLFKLSKFLDLFDKAPQNLYRRKLKKNMFIYRELNRVENLKKIAIKLI